MPLFYLPLQKQMTIVKRLIAKAESSFRGRPPGYLIVQKCRSYPQYLYRVSPDRPDRKYIKKENISFAQALAQKEYEEKFLKAAYRQKEELEKCISRSNNRSASVMYHALASPFERLSHERKALVDPYVLPDDLFIESFLKISYPPLEFNSDNPMILTENGERVRSKSEKIIADRYRHFGIPYLYERPLYLSHMGEIRPDFTLLEIMERVLVYHEHCGMMQDQAYAARTMTKIDSYIYDGYVPGDRLLLTFEGSDHVLDLSCFDQMIQHRFFE